MEEWKLGSERNQSDWDDCPGCGSAAPASMPSKALKDTWKAVHHKIDVCSVALSIIDPSGGMRVILRLGLVFPRLPRLPLFGGAVVRVGGVVMVVRLVGN